MIRIVVADDHSVVRAGLQQWLDSHADIEVVGTASDGAQAVDLALALRPDVVLMDVSMPTLDGIAATAQIRQAAPEVSVIALTTFHEQSQISSALDAGASGYLLKDVNPEVLIDGIRSVMEGGMALSPAVAAQLFRRGRETSANSALLTAREKEILQLIASGHGNKQIARALGISDKTVKSHCGRLFQRIGVTDRTQAAIWALKNLDTESQAAQRLPTAG